MSATAGSAGTAVRAPVGPAVVHAGVPPPAPESAGPSAAPLSAPPSSTPGVPLPAPESAGPSAPLSAPPSAPPSCTPGVPPVGAGVGRALAAGAAARRHVLVVECHWSSSGTSSPQPVTARDYPEDRRSSPTRPRIPRRPSRRTLDTLYVSGVRAGVSGPPNAHRTRRETASSAADQRADLGRDDRGDRRAARTGPGAGGTAAAPRRLQGGHGLVGVLHRGRARVRRLDVDGRTAASSAPSTSPATSSRRASRSTTCSSS